MVEEVIHGQINASARIIGDISVGIYRSPANALKELISNAFDAGATEVVINTDHPGFTGVTCYDNGPGMSVEELQKVFNYIGGSDKRSGGDIGPWGRPIIGKIGIGILGMSQLSKRFVIISSRAGQASRLEVEIDIEEFVSDAVTKTNLGSGKIGEYDIYTLPEAKESHYTIVTTPAGSKDLQSILGLGKSPRDRFTKAQNESNTFKEFIRKLNSMSVGILSEYNSFLWELASLTPVPYFDEGPIEDWHAWDNIKETLEGYNFRLTVDGFDIRKPILLPTLPDLKAFGEDYQVYPVDFKDAKFGLRFEGYIYHQRRQIMPSELQGMLIRIRNVGIGEYDKTLLNYPRNIGPMVKGMTGEIFVHQGLEDALNIDRNSFNQTHPHFVKLREVMFSRLGWPGEVGITKDVHERSEKRQEQIGSTKRYQNLTALIKRAGRACGRELKMVPESEGASPIEVDLRSNTVKVFPHHDTVPGDQAGQKQFFRVMLAVELFEKLGPVSNDEPGLVGWLRRI